MGQQYHASCKNYKDKDLCPHIDEKLMKDLIKEGNKPSETTGIRFTRLYFKKVIEVDKTFCSTCDKFESNKL